MNETLFSQIQRLLERTYAQVGINLEDCIIDRARSVHLSKLAGASARELNEIARTFLRHAGDQLYVGGDFKAAGGSPANGVAKWNGSEWSALGQGVDAYDN